MSTSLPSSSPCCPPGSWEAPLNPSGPSAPKGSTLTVHQGPSSINDTNAKELKIYYSPPPSPSALALIVFHDVWGHLPRLLSICDSLAEQGGFHVIAPDCFRGKTKDDVDDMLAWMKEHPYDELIANDIDACWEFGKSKGATSFGALGFCWGGWVIAKSAAAGVPWKVGVSPHPSTSVESRVFQRDETEMLAKVAMPFLLLPAGNDPDTVKPGHPCVKKLEEHGGKSIVFEDMVHGWTTRSDLNDANTKSQVEKALSLSLEFLKEHLV